MGLSHDLSDSATFDRWVLIIDRIAANEMPPPDSEQPEDDKAAEFVKAASNWLNRNMPVLLAGGNFRHGQHLAFDHRNNYPLPNLFVNLLQQVGLEVDHFATSTGTVRGLETTS